MVNYVYELDDLERNHESYARRYQVSSSRKVQALAKQVATRKPARIRGRA